ncbi:MAG TPA: type II toxin-antitoxin system CcdA family antitoxin [Nevskiales bacterium]|nr:type II toxin-antitoxin system CcdA family antitoxin [Nevskiales bacterium]
MRLPVPMAKKPTNLSVDPELLKQARALGLNLSEVFERSLEQAVREKRREQWLAENKEAIEAYNRHVERHGVFSMGLRRF